MNVGRLGLNQGENRDYDGPVVSQMSRDQQTQYLTSLAQNNPAAFHQIVLQKQGSGVATMFNASQGGGPSNAGPMGNFTGAFPQAGNVPYLQPLPQPTSSSAIDVTIAHTAVGTNFAAELARLKYTSAIPDSQDHDAVVASRLRQADRDGKSYKDALREMHGVFDFPSNLWIDYYLDRRVSINELVDEFECSRDTPAETAKGHTANSTTSALSAGASPGPTSMKQKGSSTVPQRAKPRRATLNSKAASYDSMPDPKDTVLPEPPSREPTPPTEVHTMGLRGNAFTGADIAYLIEFVNWVCRYKNWPVPKMYQKMYKRAPHHSAASWASKAKTVPIIAKIIAASMQDEDEEVGEEEVGDTYQEVDTPLPPRKRRQVGGAGTAVTDDDLSCMAGWIVENGDDWLAMSGSDRWAPFAESHDKRSWRAWMETYRRYRADIDALAEKQRRRAQASGPSGLQVVSDLVVTSSSKSSGECGREWSQDRSRFKALNA